MKYILTLSLVLGWASLGLPQFNYFSNTFMPPDWENNNGGGHNNLFVDDTVLFCPGAAYSEGFFGSWLLRVYDSGELLSQSFQPYINYQTWLTLGDAYSKSSDSNVIGTSLLEGLNGNSDVVYSFKSSLEGEISWESFDSTLVNDSTSVIPLKMLERNSSEYVIAGFQDILFVQEGEDEQGLFLSFISSEGSNIGNVVYPLWEQNWQDTIEHYTIWVTDMLSIPNNEILIAGDWVRFDNEGVGRYVPFFIKINSLNEISGHFKFGNEEIDNYNTWLLPDEDNLVLFAYGHGTQWIDLDYPEIDMRIGLFDTFNMDTLWTKSYGHAGGGWQIQDFEQTSDGGYALLGRGSDNGELMAFILKVDSEFNEEWFKIYDPPLATYDATLYDLEVTADGGMAAVGNIIATDEAFYRTWLLKLDACGDLVWSGCPFVGIEENKPASFSISPNPTNHSIQVQSSEIIHDISMTDISGRQVFAQLIMSDNKEVDLSGLSSGVYLLQATYMDGRAEVVRVVRE